MASPASTLRAQTEKSTSPLGLVAALGIHTLIVYACAVHLSQWLVFHWFGLVAPILQISINMPAADWYLQHLEIMTIVPALVIGYIKMTRFLPATIRSNIGEDQADSVGIWAWAIPTLVLGYKMLLFHPPSSVLYDNSISAINYFFDIQKVMPTMRNPLASDPIRVWAQMIVTAPFYAGVAYSLGALASKHGLLTKLFTFEKHLGPTTPPDSPPNESIGRRVVTVRTKRKIMRYNRLPNFTESFQKA